MTGIQHIDYSRERCLVVDDEEPVRENTVESLQLLDLEATGAEGGEAALAMLEEAGSFTFLITDMIMPGMDGLALIERTRKLYPDMCIIAMTGKAKSYKYTDVINCGATDFINKPFSTDELEAKIRRAIIERNTRTELNRLSITDSLTGLFNQRHFYARLREEIARAKRQKHELSLILLDLDDFKGYNDAHGHLAGDELLSKTGGIIHSSIREDVDSGYRYGGDEFAIILIDTNNSAAEVIGKRIDAVLRERLGISASMGFSQYAGDMSAETFVNMADKALYRSKEQRQLPSTK
ncbi:MAG: diguanylate cyclase response regulator [Deltaproteobacteria bacterium]|nr:MAG: diguanylate cyclase response regulator [Deltaproteobacteria bacterium]